ncbi:MAG: DUF3999 domain-containing protein [Acidobacteriota bacterium]|nr:DUF3999 domain-containing protein [Acidobacteriota bacterium]
MSRILSSIVVLLLAGGSSPSYFKYRRAIQAPAPGGQHYFVVDETIWQHARPDLSDLRLYTAEKEIPYKLAAESGGSETEQKQLRVLQPATVSGKTQFILDMSGLEEYDRINLKLATKNFVAHARVEGQDDLRGPHWALLGTTTLYDLSDEKLGSNTTLQIPLSTFRYLRVAVDSSVKPADVQSGTAGITRAQKAVWRELAVVVKQEQRNRDTVLSFEMSPNVPVERLVLSIDPAQKNFRREISTQNGEQVSAAGEISRIHMLRNGRKVDVEQTSLDLCRSCSGNPVGADTKTLKFIIHNGDDQPLKITSARLQQFERRIYFEADSAPLWLYYGDDHLGAPEYDYAKLFQKDARADAIALSNEEANSAYSGRPDERPWSERHPAVLWTTIIAAVLILGGIAVRSLKTAPRLS